MITGFNDYEHSDQVAPSDNHLSLVDVDLLSWTNQRRFNELNWQEACEVCNFKRLRHHPLYQVSQLILSRLKPCLIILLPKHNLLEHKWKNHTHEVDNGVASKCQIDTPCQIQAQHHRCINLHGLTNLLQVA